MTETYVKKYNIPFNLHAGYKGNSFCVKLISSIYLLTLKNSILDYFLSKNSSVCILLAVWDFVSHRLIASRALSIKNHIFLVGRIE